MWYFSIFERPNVSNVLGLTLSAVEDVMTPVFEFSKLPLLGDYEKISEDQLVERILAQKKKYGSDLIILGHHYQRPKITKLSDFVGDSFGLSAKAADANGKNIVFCGVRFMAESAAILAQANPKGLSP